MSKTENGKRKIKFRLFDFNMILSICEDNSEDRNKIKELSPLNASYIALALSLDSLAAGFGSGLINVDFLQMIAFSLAFNILAVSIGCFCGRKLAEKIKMNVAWLGGVIIILLAFLKLR